MHKPWTLQLYNTYKVYALPFECYYAGTNFDILVHQDLDSDHNFTLDYLKVRQIAIESPTIPHLQTRWYSPLSGVSIRRTPEPPRFRESWNDNHRSLGRWEENPQTSTLT
jgi:hypothetical protein